MKMNQSVSTQKQQISGKMDVLDAIRGISAVGIVIYHYGHFVQVGLTDYPFDNILKIVYIYGHYLVDLFFIISGFLFYKTFAKRIIDCKINLREFLRNRYIKLFPLFLMTTAVTAVGQWILLYNTGSTFVHEADLYSLFLNIVGLQHVGFGNAVAFNGPAWYISVLMFCYLTFFLICRYKRFGGGYFILFFLAMYKCNLSIPMLTQQVFRGLLGFSVGRICYFIWLNVKRKYVRNMAGIIMVFTLVLWCIFGQKQIDIFGDVFLYFVLVFWPSLFLFCVVSVTASKILSNKVFIWLGRISYSIFLWHFPIEVLLVIFDNFTSYKVDFNKSEVWVIRMLLSLVTAVISYYFIEPILNKLIRKSLLNTTQNR